jgi:hypothetical protein
LHDDDHLQATFDDAVALTADGLPEEHRMGEVLGSFMTDLRLSQGTKSAMRTVYAALPFIPNDMAGIGYDHVDDQNAWDAVRDFDAIFVWGLIQADEAAGGKNLGAIHGAAAARGVLNNFEAGTTMPIDLASRPKGKVKISSRFLIDADVHVYSFRAPTGSKLKATLQGKGGVKPDLIGIAGTVGDLKVVTSQGGAKVVVTGTIEDGATDYMLELQNAGTLGSYTLTLDI